MSESVPSELAAHLLSRGHTVRLRAGGGSMRPALRPGALVTVEPVAGPGELRVGDVAFVVSGGRPMLHRVVAAAPTLRTKGDALGHFDPPPDAVLGRVIGSGGAVGWTIALISRRMQPVQRLLILTGSLLTALRRSAPHRRT